MGRKKKDGVATAAVDSEDNKESKLLMTRKRSAKRRIDDHEPMGDVATDSAAVDSEELKVSKLSMTRKRSAKRKVDDREPIKMNSHTKNETTGRRKTNCTGTKQATLSEKEPILKKAKVASKASDVKEEAITSEIENCSSDSGISSTPVSSSEKKNVLEHSLVKKEKCSERLQLSKIDDSSSESEWEEVEENEELCLDDYKPEIPKEGVEITIEGPNLNIRKRKKNQFDVMDYIRLQVNRSRREAQLNVHKTHLLCLLAHGFYLNDVLNSPILKCLALSCLPADLLSLTSGRKVDKVDGDGIERVVAWFCESFSFESRRDAFLDFRDNVIECFETKVCSNAAEYNLMFITFARTLGFKTRLCLSFYPATHKAQNLIKKKGNESKEKKEKLEEESKNENKNVPQKTTKTVTKVNKDSKSKTLQKGSKKKQKVSNNPEELKSVQKEKPRPKRSSKSGKSYKEDSEGEDDDKNKDEDFISKDDVDSSDELQPTRKRSTKTTRTSNRKILSSESDPPSPENTSFKSDKITCWAELFSKPDKEWISVECVNRNVNKPYEIEASAPQPVTYVVAYDNNSYIKDVTRRYCSEYLTSTIKLRPDEEWWEETLSPFLPPSTKIDKDEEKVLETMLVNKPLPTTVAGFKNHPLYALKRHLLKFEAIYPPDTPSVGFIRGEPVYPRDCVAQLHSRETWLKEARVVRIGEEPYKIVKARPKWDRMAGGMRTDLPLNVFGFWQTEPYQPPIAVDGKVPRNEYGNVELFKPSMLPIGTVHLQLPGLNRIAKKLGIDCSPAVVGFDGHKGSVHAVFDGFIICEEYKETILAAWDEEQENSRKREEEKREKRIYGNWKKLIRGLLIRERIKLKYYDND